MIQTGGLLQDFFTVGTTFNKRLYESKYQQIVESMETFYPDVNFFVFHENKFEKERYNDNGVQLKERDNLHILDVFELNPWLSNFLNESPFGTSYEIGTPGTYDPPHYWRRNGIYWFRKVVAINNIKIMVNTPLLLWVGCDTKFLKPIDQEFMEHVTQFDICYIHRAPVFYTETDILVFNLMNPTVSIFLQEWLNFYLSGDIFKKERWDDCIAFDNTRVKFEEQLKWGSLLDKTGCPFNVYDYILHHKRPLHKIRDKRKGV